MSGLLKKRGREEADEVAFEPKRCFREAEILNLLEDVDSEDRNTSEELLSGVMRSLEEEIGVSCSTSYEGSDTSGLSRESSILSDIACGSGAANGVDIDYLLGASDDELGILPSCLLDFGEENSAPQTILTGDGGSTPLGFENPELKGLSSINWSFEDDLVEYRQFSYDLGDVVHDAFDGDDSAYWRPETAGGLY